MRRERGWKEERNTSFIGGREMRLQEKLYKSPNCRFGREVFLTKKRNRYDTHQSDHAYSMQFPISHHKQSRLDDINTNAECAPKY